MHKLAWLLLIVVLAFGGYRVWDRNAHPVAIQPPAITQPIETPTPPVVQAPAPEPRARPAPRRPQPPKAPPGKPKIKPKPKAPPAATPPAAPDSKFPRGAANGASLPVSCATVRWYAKYAPALGQKLSAAYHPTAEQITAAKACLKS